MEIIYRAGERLIDPQTLQELARRRTRSLGGDDGSVLNSAMLVQEEIVGRRRRRVSEDGDWEAFPRGRALVIGREPGGHGLDQQRIVACQIGEMGIQITVDEAGRIPDLLDPEELRRGLQRSKAQQRPLRP